jgi:hypothetical protein
MYAWNEVVNAAPEITSAAARLFDQNEVAFLATVSASGRPRLHPFVPKVCAGRFVAFIIDSSPKSTDLIVRNQCSIHALPGAEDEEVFLSGSAERCPMDADFRQKVVVEMGFATGVDDDHVLFEFLFDRALWTRWLDFGTSAHRPEYLRWNLAMA